MWNFPAENDGEMAFGKQHRSKLFQDVELEVDGFLVSCTICPCPEVQVIFFLITQVLTS